MLHCFIFIHHPHHLLNHKIKEITGPLAMVLILDAPRTRYYNSMSETLPSGGQIRQSSSWLRHIPATFSAQAA